MLLEFAALLLLCEAGHSRRLLRPCDLWEQRVKLLCSALCLADKLASEEAGDSCMQVTALTSQVAAQQAQLAELGEQVSAIQAGRTQDADAAAAALQAMEARATAAKLQTALLKRDHGARLIKHRLCLRSAT